MSVRPDPSRTLFATPAAAAGQPLELSEPPEDALAVWLAAAAGDRLHVAASERRAERLAAVAAALAPDRAVHLFRPWDCLPYDRASPSAEIMGSRMAVLGALAAPHPPALVITTGDALVQRVQPSRLWTERPDRSADALALTLNQGQPFEAEPLRRFLLAVGYTLDVHVDEPGHATLGAAVVDLFPAADSTPVRLEIENGHIHAIHRFDPVSQRTTGVVDAVRLTPASELLLDRDLIRAALEQKTKPKSASFLDPAALAAEVAAAGRPRAGGEHWLLAFGATATLLDYMPDAAISMDAGVEEGIAIWRDQIADGYEARVRHAADQGSGDHHPLPPDRLYLTPEQVQASLSERRVVRFAAEADAALAPVPERLPLSDDRSRRPALLVQHLRKRHTAGDRIVLALGDEAQGPVLRRLLGRGFPKLPDPCTLDAALAGKAGSVATVLAPLAHGFALAHTLVVGAAVLLGSGPDSHAHDRHPAEAALMSAQAIGIGDLVVHEEHGVGRVLGLDRLDGAARHDCLALGYGGDERLLVPVEELGRVWRYGSEDTGVALDHLKSPRWAERRAGVEAAIEQTAAGLAAQAAARARLTAPVMAPTSAYARSASRFPFTPTADQQTAIDAVLADLSSGRPMDRLVCGDVGFGKTEIALRAAAVAAFAGWQVAVIAPTTVLAQQHLESFTKRFAGLGVEVAGLSRLTAGAEGRRIQEGIADGRIGIVVGTSAVAARTARFAKLGLVIVDEEQRFGEKDKERFRALGVAVVGDAEAATEDGQAVHTLVLTATPIPRTLQSALVGAQAFSVLATPPVRRQPVRTSVLPYDATVLLEALEREKRRGGQSFVVCPRIEDLEPLRAELGRLVPGLTRVVAHGKMKGPELDAVMSAFTKGEADVLLATNIIEAGLDIPNANTMAIWRADRFGLSQLHQLRGRVGRGRRRAAAYLFTEAGVPLHPRTERRLRTLETLDRLGAGFEISARDLDQRGAGDLLGESQAGHVKLIGTELYQTLLADAVRRAKGETPAADAGTGALHHRTPALNLGLEISIPAEYVAEEATRIDLFRRIARAAEPADLDALGAEMVDRFGPLPPAVEQLLHQAQLRLVCHALGIAHVDAGPRGVAATVGEGRLATVVRVGEECIAGATVSRARTGELRIVVNDGTVGGSRLARIDALLRELDRHAAGQVSA